MAVASPEFARTHLPDGLTAHNFREVTFVCFNRKDDMQAEFVARRFGLKRVSLSSVFVPSSEGQVRAVAAGWGVSVVPELMAAPLIANGQLVDLAPGFRLLIQLYWHSWNLESNVLDALSDALTRAAAHSLAAH
ncbi:HTH-type transcriptional regulator ArgP [bioreactor metagenome]|uniref:HTH-type transcriptional regulator ArgP n=1 Tax=bioreactor metagenome TaxID=1076179 RepID=A0A645CHY4_9ZZZZ